MSIPETHLAQEAIVSLVDGELAAGPATRAARHLSGCTECRLAVQAQREAKEALHSSRGVDVPGDLLSRLQAIPFTAEVSSGGLGTVTAGRDHLTVSGSGGAFAVPLEARPSALGDARAARWFRRGVIGTVTGLGVGVTMLALSLPADPPERGAPSRSVAGPSIPDQRSEVAPPVMRSLTSGTAADEAPRAGGTP